MKKIYNDNEEKFLNLTKDLKKLPKINAPENFELNLMTKIQNSNFGRQDKRPQFSWIKFLTPSAVVATAIILFFIFLPTTQQDTDTKLKESEKAISQNAEQNTYSSNNMVVDKSDDKTLLQNSKRASNSDNLAATTREKLLINNPRAIKLDDYISGANENQKDLTRGNVVSSGDEPVEFDGFYLTPKPDKITLEKYRARLDSIKKAQAKADSLKKIRK